eukprot:scaffold4768_cov412-Prasinococcus_capsulatus_cf.AAC.12
MPQAAAYPRTSHSRAADPRARMTGALCSRTARLSGASPGSRALWRRWRSLPAQLMGAERVAAPRTRTCAHALASGALVQRHAPRKRRGSQYSPIRMRHPRSPRCASGSSK